MDNYQSLSDFENRINVLLFGAGTDFSLSVVRALGQIPNLILHELTDEDGIDGINQKSRYTRTYKTINAPTRLITPAQVLQHAKSINAEILLPVTEPAVYWAAQHRKELKKHLKLPAIPDTTIFKKVVNKYELNLLLKEKGFPVPKNILVDNSKLKELINKVEYPVIYKPVVGGGGWEIHQVDNSEELLRLLSQENNKYHYLLQEFIPGYNIDCSVIAEDGTIVGATIQKPLTNRGFTFATGIEFVEEPRLMKMIENVMAAIGWSGVAHLDLRYDERDDSYKIIDFNGRYWSTLLGSLAAGINFPLLAVLQALELPYDRQQYKPVSFMMNTPAVKALLNRIIGRKNKNFKFEHSELKYALYDLKPEITRAISHISREWIQSEEGVANYSTPDLQQMIEWGGASSEELNELI